MGLQVVVIFIDSFMDDVTFVRDVDVCTYNMICYIPWCIWYGSENSGLGSLHDDCIGLVQCTDEDNYSLLSLSVSPYVNF